MTNQKHETSVLAAEQMIFKKQNKEAKQQLPNAGSQAGRRCKSLHGITAPSFKNE